MASEASVTVTVRGIGGNTTTRTYGTLRRFGRATILESSPVNVLPLSLVEDLYETRIATGDGIYVKIDGETELLFKRNVDGLYVCNFTNDVINAMYTTVSGNKARFTAREVCKAQQARKVIEQLGYPSDSDMRGIILQGGILNMPITASDVALHSPNLSY